MKYVEKLYGREYLEKQRDMLLKMPEPSGVPYFLVGESTAAKIRQAEFNKYLELAFCHNLIDNDLKSRLFSDHWDVFFQTHRELMCAYFVEKILNYKISFHPKGAGNSVGECLLYFAENENIFVEVKAPIRVVRNQVWSGNDAVAIKRNLKRAIKQMPARGQKNMPIFAGALRIHVSDEASGIMEALYGEESGMFQLSFNTRMSAVATLEDSIVWSPEINLIYVFKVYHNPYAKNPIDRDIFSGWPQFVPNMQTNSMEWIDDKHVG